MNKLLRHTLAIFASLAVFAAKADSVPFQGVTLEYTDAKVLWPSGAEGEGDIVFVYTNTVNTGTLALPGSAVARILTVGGGGAGSATMSDETKAKNVGGGGGDAGKLVEKDKVSLNNGVYVITVGAGGEGTAGGDTTIALDGKILADWTASGGAMGNELGYGGNNYTGKGGGEPKSQDVLVFGGSGGSGEASDITGEELYYAAGGGGAVLVGNNRGLGGSGVGGNGAFGAGGQIPATNGVRGSGGGGGSERTPAGKGGDGVVIIRLSAVVGEPLVRPSKLQPEDGYYYNGEKQNAINSSIGYTISGDTYKIDVGSYTTTAKLANGFRWDDTDPDTDDTVNWEIKKAKNRIDNLVIGGWKVGAKANSPTCTPRWGQVSYYFADSADAEEWLPFNALSLTPKTAGLWYLKASTPETANWEGAEAIVSFYLWDDESAKNFSDYVTITLPEGVGELFKFTLAEDNPHGFNHVRAKDGFFVLDANGQMLDYEIESWNVEGVSTIKLSAPGAKAGDAITIYWSPDDGKAPPPTKLGEVENPTAVGFSLVTRNRLKVNYFVENPTIDPVRWELQLPPKSLDVKKGRLADGANVSNYFYFATTPDVHFTDYHEMKRAGTYIAAFVPEAIGDYEQLVHTIEINVIGHNAYTSLGSSAEGRALLMNNDCREGSRSVPSINYQGWYDAINAGAMRQTPTYWEHRGLDEDLALYNLRPGTSSVLYAYSEADETTTELWRLNDCRHGNTFPRNDDNADLVDDQNYLPYDANNSLRISEHSTRAVRRRDVGQIVMRNTLDAAVVSPCYTNGIGTIYFDAVNGWTSPEYLGTNSYQIAVEAVFGEAAAYVADESELWQPLTLHSLKIEAGKVVGELEGEVLKLDITEGGSTSYFYRVYAPVEANGLARFRIRRVSIDAERSANPDGKALILLDNVLASYPAMKVDLEPSGVYDRTRRGKEIMGFEGVCIPTYPAIGDAVYAQARATYRTAGDPSLPVNTNAFVSSSRMHYRWRYLNQATNDWQTVFLNPDDGFKSTEPLVLPSEIGDVEFYYETEIQAPYYSYVDYTGLGIGVPDYTEEIPVVTNRADEAENVYPTMGTDWFVRLREGKSNYGLVRVFTRAGKDAPVVETPLAVVGEHQWRGYVRTPEAIAEGLEFRLEGVSLGEDFEHSVTNYWKAEYDLMSLANAKSVQLVKGAVDSWAKVECTAATGHLMFMIDDSSRSLTVTRADYQNFNGWNDANKQEEIFVGSSEAEGRISGVAGRMKSFTERFENWNRCDPSSPYWQESFAQEISSEGGYPGYVPFISSKTPNGWTAGHGMWVHEKFQKEGMALQLEGQGQGYLEFQNAAVAPRGLEKIVLSGRLAQSIQFGDIAYSFADGRVSLKNYTFVVQAVMSEQQPVNNNRIEDFTGNGQISVIANYRPMVGCYEFRVTRIDEKRIAYELLKWTASGGTLKATTLTGGQHNIAGFSNWANTPFVRGSDGNRPVMYISVDSSNGGVKIQAGYCRARSSFNAMPAAGENFMSVCYWDSDTTLARGTFGVASANCPAAFRAPRYYDKPATWLGSVRRNVVEYFDTNPVVFNGAVHNEKANLEKEDWALENGRYKSTAVEGAWGVYADALPQTVAVQWAKRGTSDWTTVATAKIDGYLISDPITLPLYIRDDAALRIVHGGAMDDARVDVVIDDVSFTQWRGDDYSNSATQPFFRDVQYGSPTNFVFTSAWVDGEVFDDGEEGEHWAELSPMRTLEGVPASIRAPLMDGYEGGGSEIARGIGLGMFTFAYRNADSNAKLWLQIATNEVDVTGLKDLTAADPDDERWTTMAEFDFSQLPPNGICSHYLGLHDVVGTMRIVVAPDVVTEAGAQDRPDYGRIVITQAFCRDEPALDTSCWWGWNLRTSSDLHKPGDAQLMYLSDNVADGGPLEDYGLSVALNNSVYSDTIYEEEAAYKEHQPFVQTPTFKDAEVGEVILKARRYDVTKGETARITVYGAKSGDLTDDSQWKYVTHFDITDNLYHTYSYRTEPGDEYKVFRFAVVGVKDAREMGGKDDPRPDSSVRVAFDEVVVCEAVRPMLAFRNVFAFRSDLKGRKFNSGYQNKAEQPLADEDFSVQAEVYAAQLPDDVDFDKGVKVKLHWYVKSKNGLMTWGYDNWKDDSAVQHLDLVECEDAPLVFRGSYDNSSCIAAIKEPGSVVQYMLEVEYYTVESDKPVKTLLRKNDWEKPRWYVGIDYNDVEYKAYNSFAAYTILDSVSPGWAWINEVNVFGGYADEVFWKNRDEDHQFIEVAIPFEASIPGWHLDFISLEGTTNTACMFVDPALSNNRLALGEAAASKKTHDDSNCVFLSVASPTSSDNITSAGGDVDGTWKLALNDWTFTADGRLASDFYPVAVRLVRNSGVIEHEIVFEGTNCYNEISSEKGYEYSAKKLALELNDGEAGGTWFDVGADMVDGDHSLSVLAAHGETAENWSNTPKRTPGRKNEGQTINPEHPTPSGSTVFVYCKVDPDPGHFVQTVGDKVKTTETALVIVPKESSIGTNVVYEVENWYELDSVTTNGVPIALGERRGKVTVNIARNATGSIEVIAKTRFDSRLDEYVKIDDPYRPAIVDWLNKGTNARGEEFESDENPQEIHIADLMKLNDEIKRPLSLTEMYWLDINPFQAGWAFKAGFTELPYAVIVDADAEEGDIKEDRRVGVYMCITNRVSGVRRAPDVLRSLDPGKTSWDYISGEVSSWTSVTFKVTGYIANGLPYNVGWVPLRWFVFGPNSFNPAGSEKEFQSSIEIIDPYSRYSPTWKDGWGEWWGKRDSAPVLHWFNINPEITNIGVETLSPTNWYEFAEKEGK